MSDDVVIRLEGVWKRYGLRSALRERWNRLRHIQDNRGPWALRDLNLEVKRGETLGIMGRNGAGKSTLLKLLAGVSPLSRGKMEVKGRVFPMIELNAGLHRELTGRENVFLLGAIMGLDRNKMRNLLPAIEEFCELGDYFNQPVRTYSSGMLARLGFSVAVNVDADIMLIDEVLAVGDIGFQRRCYRRMHELQRQNKTILLVSHNPYAIERHCSSALIMRNGQVEASGTPAEMFYKYFASFEDAAHVAGAPSNLGLPPSRPGSGEVRITRVQILDVNEQEVDAVYPGDTVIFRLHFKCYEPLYGPNFTLQVQTLDNLVVASFLTTSIRKQFTIHTDGYLDCQVEVNLNPNSYVLSARIAEDGRIDIVENAGQFRVLPSELSIFVTGNMGLLYLKPEWRLTQVESSA